ncbi:hypothetical protein Trco_003542 [Trichoderma cornu-damae]|uniref:Transmembrane protein n=1 Tax=Trichoderma cornu-damae TaxID=654480 RepID=A0A9P8QL89_9HYPO|nr:hypothetical protein Trco_003542 [Trichoderma cornu-damae]
MDNSSDGGFLDLLFVSLAFVSLAFVSLVLGLLCRTLFLLSLDLQLNRGGSTCVLFLGLDKDRFLLFLFLPFLPFLPFLFFLLLLLLLLFLLVELGSNVRRLRLRSRGPARCFFGSNLWLWLLL